MADDEGHPLCGARFISASDEGAFGPGHLKKLFIQKRDGCGDKPETNARFQC